jgi:hypothetical protein
MAGVKGRSGGARVGSGPKPKPVRKTSAKCYQTDDPDDFLRALMKDPKADFKDRLAAALAMKKVGKTGGLMGKKEQKQAAAEAVVTRSLAPSPAPSASRPKLMAVK